MRQTMIQFQRFKAMDLLLCSDEGAKLPTSPSLGKAIAVKRLQKVKTFHETLDARPYQVLAFFKSSE